MKYCNDEVKNIHGKIITYNEIKSKSVHLGEHEEVKVYQGKAFLKPKKGEPGNRYFLVKDIMGVPKDPNKKTKGKDLDPIIE